MTNRYIRMKQTIDTQSKIINPVVDEQFFIFVLCGSSTEDKREKQFD